MRPMKEKLEFIRLPLLLVVIFFVGRLVLGAAGVSYDAGNRVFLGAIGWSLSGLIPQERISRESR